MDQKLYQEVVAANIALHSNMANDYSTCEPHFRPENVSKVEETFKKIVAETKATKHLDLGCGTGFMINISKKHVPEICGVDVTPAMLAKVDKSGNAKIRLIEADTGSAPVEDGYFDVVTAYSFLHHLYDVTPTLKTAHRALKPGGVFYADLDPNFYFWEEIKKLSATKQYDEIVAREIRSVSHRDDEIQAEFNVSKDTFNKAEYSKNIKGGFREEELEAQLKAAGFKDIKIFYNWFLGQGSIINDERFAKSERFKFAEIMDETLQKALPVSRTLYKYLGFYATK